jgi:hypothetical protein
MPYRQFDVSNCLYGILGRRKGALHSLPEDFRCLNHVLDVFQSMTVNKRLDVGSKTVAR